MDFFKFIRVDFPTGIFALPPGILSILTQNISHVYNMPQQLDYRWSLNSVSKLRNAEYQTIAITIALHIQVRIPSRLTWGKMQINLRLYMQWTHDLHGTIFLLETITLFFFFAFAKARWTIESAVYNESLINWFDWLCSARFPEANGGQDGAYHIRSKRANELNALGYAFSESGYSFNDEFDSEEGLKWMP